MIVHSWDRKTENMCLPSRLCNNERHTEEHGSLKNELMLLIFVLLYVKRPKSDVLILNIKN